MYHDNSKKDEDNGSSQSFEYDTVEDLVARINACVGDRFSDYDIAGRLKNKRNKGALGQVVEEGIFHYKVNSRKGPDFEKVNTELKVTPVKVVGKGKNQKYSAKERLVLNIIDYNTDFFHSFYESDFWKKNSKLLLCFYKWEKELSIEEYEILGAMLHVFSKEDLAIVMNDWHTIQRRVMSGEAHLITEADTMYLAACTKGKDHTSMRTQPYSAEKAKQRAYSLKTTYMTQLVRGLMGTVLPSCFRANELVGQEDSFEKRIKQAFLYFIGRSTEQIADIVGYQINPKNKAYLANLAARIVKGGPLDNLEETDEFAKANIKLKTIRLEPDGLPREHMSFENLDFQALWENDVWEYSQFYRRFAETKFLFIVFEYIEPLTKDNKNTRKLYLKKVFLWNMPETIIQNNVYNLWAKTRRTLQEGIKFEIRSGKVYNNLPSAVDDPICHIRPKAQNSKDKVLLPNGQTITKQAYWLDRHYIAKIIAEVQQ